MRLDKKKKTRTGRGRDTGETREQFGHQASPKEIPPSPVKFRIRMCRERKRPFLSWVIKVYKVVSYRCKECIAVKKNDWMRRVGSHAFLFGKIGIAQGSTRNSLERQSIGSVKSSSKLERPEKVFSG